MSKRIAACVAAASGLMLLALTLAVAPGASSSPHPKPHRHAAAPAVAADPLTAAVVTAKQDGARARIRHEIRVEKRRARLARERRARARARAAAQARPAQPNLAAPAAVPVGVVQQIAAQIFGSQYGCAAAIIARESGWNVHAMSPTGAYGLPQALPGSKMASAGPDWVNSPRTQLLWMLGYVNSRYGGACAAWAWWQTHGWY